ncbi:uncharacterized protein LOC125179390 [Hyalella azteca]|uniref:Uncharacterized protein LOC125179390 n=1 Tax=Hyalella azteca TaxID=294128 RepID=A0A979FXC1_HYAAZ|nr:uncharacterized protein LOC125179390 [Hyalella azteca]
MYLFFAYHGVIREAFITEGTTSNGSPDNLKKMCGAEGGVPLIINTKQLLREARQLVSDHGTYQCLGLRMAWLSAYQTHHNGTFYWPDNSPVIGCVFTAGDFHLAAIGETVASTLRADGKIDKSQVEPLLTNLPVLCGRIF